MKLAIASPLSKVLRIKIGGNSCMCNYTTAFIQSSLFILKVFSTDENFPDANARRRIVESSEGVEIQGENRLSEYQPQGDYASIRRVLISSGRRFWFQFLSFISETVYLVTDFKRFSCFVLKIQLLDGTNGRKGFLLKISLSLSLVLAFALNTSIHTYICACKIRFSLRIRMFFIRKISYVI